MTKLEEVTLSTEDGPWLVKVGDLVVDTLDERAGPVKVKEILNYPPNECGRLWAHQVKIILESDWQNGERFVWEIDPVKS